MKKVFVLGAILCTIVTMISCGEKEQDLTPVHNQLFQTSWEGRYDVYGENDGYEWHNHYILHINFLTDDSVCFYGEKWKTDNSYYKTGPYKVAEWNDTMKYSFSQSNGVIYGENTTVWDGNETPIQYGINDSLQIQTKQIGFVSLAKK